jgi:hypothetical protein
MLIYILLRSLEFEENHSGVFKKAKTGDTREERKLIRKKYQGLKMEVAKNIWNASVDLKGSLGEKYLVKHRKIPSMVVERLDFRFLPKDSTYQDYRVSFELIKISTFYLKSLLKRFVLKL